MKLVLALLLLAVACTEISYSSSPEFVRLATTLPHDGTISTPLKYFDSDIEYTQFQWRLSVVNKTDRYPLPTPKSSSELEVTKGKKLP